MANKVKTADFLPEIFKTDTNRQFLAASLDILTQQTNLKRVEGFIGNRYGTGVTPNDRYVVEPTTVRSDYQLDPSVVFLKPDTQVAQDFINYPGMVGAIRNQGGIVNNHDRLWTNEFYSWDPFVDYDRVVNYAQYYWIPLGPDAIPVTVSGNIDTTIVGQATFTTTNNITLINGLKILFDDTVEPATYRGNQYYVEGVGSSITLVPVSSLVVPEASGSALYGFYDLEPYDTTPYDAQLYASVNPDYLTVNRASRDANAWTRSNRWFHQSVIDATAAALGAATSSRSNQPQRALRPILEFRANLQLWNGGTLSGGAVTLLDTNTTDALSSIVGQSSYIIDGVNLQQDQLVVFAMDASATVRQTIYEVNFVPAGPGGELVIALDAKSTMVNKQQIVVLQGTQWAGSSWRWSIDSQQWLSCQQKTLINQAPLFDIYDAEGISFGDTLFYRGSTFTGTPLFSYSAGTGAPDPVLGFPIAYSSVTNIGDISFTVNLNSDTFSYSTPNNQIVESTINRGFVHWNTTPTTYELLTGWVPAAAPSIQYQVFEFATTQPTSVFRCDVGAVDQSTTPWQTVQVYVNDTILDDQEFTVTVVNATTTVELATSVPEDTRVSVLIYSNDVSTTAYYTVPSNLQSNPFNANITTVDVGDIRNQYRTIYSNTPGVTGPLFGNNNIGNLGPVNQYGTSIIQNSSSLVLPGLFLRKPQVEFFQALEYNRDQYNIYRQLIVDLAYTNDYSRDQTPAEILDSIIYEITTTRSNSTAFFWTDTLFSGSPAAVNIYTFGATPISAVFTLDRVYTTDRANYYAVALYLTRTVNGQRTTQQLVRGRDYVVSPIAASVTVTVPITAGDTITVKEYNQTYGSYCPSTPSSLGLYPAYVPEVVYDQSYNPPTHFIQGHDGSYTRLYGPYENGQLVDFRDIALLEFETRIYNNIKTPDTPPLTAADVVPGQWRTTDYTLDEIVEIYSTEFLNWVGANKIDYKTQVYNLANPFTYNYNQSEDKLSNQPIPQGYWRGIYRWLYDTDSPDTRPWELLGLTVKPSWWDTRYGLPPYTSGNTLMWNEIAQGYIWNGGVSYVDPQRVRPQLLEVLPVNSAGELQNPFTVIVGNYNKLTFNRDWRVGDVAPAESSYLKSPNWPFDLMRLLALTKPAQFFNLCADLDRYRYDPILGQYLYDGRYHLDPRTLEVYGNGTAKNSYINWIVDWVNVRNLNGYQEVTTLLQNLDVRLTYNLAGFSAKDYLKFYIERATPNSKNTSFLVPDESYSVLLYDNVPEERIRYSSVIVQRVSNGWRVWGNSMTQHYFTTVVPKLNGFYRNIEVNGTTIRVWNDWYLDRTQTVPYGTLFYSREQVSDFLNNYGHYLLQQGVVFENISQGTVYDWDRMISEFINWSQQEWELGTLIALNPNAQYFTVNREGLVVQPLTMTEQNFILNQNLIPIEQQNSAVIRENLRFSVKILSDGDTVAYTNLNLNSIEHAVVFDNSSVFNDVIYNLTTGLRQQRLLLKGYKTADWQGWVDTQGFILNENNIQEWQSNRKYAKGSIVLYKSLYWVASTLIEPSVEFNTQQWFRINYDQIKQGLLPNPSTNAYESLFYYDSNRANLELDADQLAFSLIGYRPREYMSAADLSDITQINVYKNLIREKGTNLIAEGFRNAEFDQGAIDYNIYENWAIRSGIFGSVLNSNWVEAELDQHQLTGNPTLLAFSTTGPVANTNQTVLISELINWGREPLTANFLPPYLLPYTAPEGLPSAGYVDARDAGFSVFDYLDLNSTATNITQLRAGDAVWVANYRGSWAVFRAQSLRTQLVSIYNNQNGTLTFTTAQPHGLVALDPFAVSSFSDLIDGFYVVRSVLSLNQFIVDYAISADIVQQTGSGIVFRMVNVRYAQASSVAAAVNRVVDVTPWRTTRSWIDDTGNDKWAVLGQSPVFGEIAVPITPTPELGSSVAYDSRWGVFAGDRQQNEVYVWSPVDGSQFILSGGAGFGNHIRIVESGIYVAEYRALHYYSIQDDNSIVLEQVIPTADTISSIAVSDDGAWLYIAQEDSNSIQIRLLNPTTNQYGLPYTLTKPPSALGWGRSISTSIDGLRLVVGAPLQTVSGSVSAGAVWVYSLSYQRFLASGSSNQFTPSGTLAADSVRVLVNSVVTTDWTLQGSATVVLATTPTQGSTVTIIWATPVLLQEITQTTQTGAMLGASVDTNRWGSNIVAGAPFDSSVSPDGLPTEGTVYQWVNSGQRYGQITLRNPQVAASTSIRIDGYRVEFSTTTANTVLIADAINTQTPTNIVATATTSPANTVFITVRDNTVETPGNIIDLVATPTVSSLLNYTAYALTQEIVNPLAESVGRWGSVVKMNESAGLLISATTAGSPRPTTWDYTQDCRDNDTIWDNDTTTFVDITPDQGLVAEYTLLSAANESLGNPAQYAFGQFIVSGNTQWQGQSKWGSALAYSDGAIVVGAPNWTTETGLVSLFISQPFGVGDCRVVQAQPWYVDKTEAPQVDISRINNVSIYNRLTNTTISTLDYCDPLQGRLLGAIATNLDYTGTQDPAGYNPDSQQWGPEQVGRTWLDTSNLRILNYSQPDPVYNATNWGRAFPGSSADVYTWVESTTDPLNYVGAGFPRSFENYVTRLKYDGATNSTVPLYYFWVKNLDAVPPGKTLSPLTVSAYLLNPVNSGIEFIAPLTTQQGDETVSVVAIYNSSGSIRDYTSVLHIGYGNNQYQDTQHQVWDLIAANNSSSFLGGLPLTTQQQPERLYLKYLDSFSGVNNQYQDVPNPRLPLLVQSGVSFNPQQTMFLNRRLALENYCQYANRVLLSQPVVETRNLALLMTNNVVPNLALLGSVVSATTVDLGGFYSNGLNGVGATLSGIGALPLIGGVALATGDRVLIKDQDDETQNGIYVVTQATANWILTRASDFDDQIQEGQSTVVTGGIWKDTLWTMTTPGTIITGISTIQFTQGGTTPTYDTRQFWTYADWWAAGYDSTTKPQIEVDSYLELQTISQGNIITGTGGLLLVLADGLVARVNQNSFGLPEIWVYSTTEGWTRVGVIGGTVQILPQLWQNTYAYDTEVYDSQPYDREQYVEVRNIVRWLNEVVYDNDLLEHRNQSLILMFDYIQSENRERNNYNPWLMKTSLIDVKHRIRGLLQYKKYQRDNAEFLSGYLNEVKPFHVYVKDFVYSYDGLDVYGGNITDFDLPAEYNSGTGNWMTPELVFGSPAQDNQFQPDDPVWQEPEYNQWFQNWGLSYNTLTQQLLSVTQLTSEIDDTTTELPIANFYGLQNSGVVYIGAEQIQYTGVDRDGLLITGCVRGFNGTLPTPHSEGAAVSVVNRGVLVLDSGRGYTQPPAIEVTLAASGLPLPRANAEMVAVTTNGTLSAVTVTNTGSGYATDPVITVDSSTVSASFVRADIDTANNTIRLLSNPFVTGDSVVFQTSNTLVNWGLSANGYYYVRRVDSNTIALYDSYRAARVIWLGVTELLNSIDATTTTITVTDSNALPNRPNTIQLDDEWITYTGINESTATLTGVVRGALGTLPESHAANTQVRVNSTQYPLLDAQRVPLANTGSATGSLLVTARVEGCTESYPVRQMTVGLRFDRTTYVSDLAYSWDATPWDATPWDDTNGVNAANRIEADYRPTVNMPGRNLPQLMESIEYPNPILQGLEFGAARGWDLFGWDLNATLGWDGSGDENTLIDTLLQAPQFTDTQPTLYDILGGQFPDGYAPEELVAGVVSDFLCLTVITDDATLSFRQIVDKSNNSVVLNSNPFTQVFLVEDLDPTDAQIYVSDVSPLIDTRFNSVGNVIYINGEFIRFTTVDSGTNALGGLQRGIMGTAVTGPIKGGTLGVTDIQPGLLYSIVSTGSTDFTLAGAPSNAAGTVFYANSNSGNLTGSGTVTPVVQSMLESNKLFQSYESLWWYGPPSDPSANTTLATNTSVPAEFLQRTSP